jgi:hypothetical protein
VCSAIRTFNFGFWILDFGFWIGGRVNGRPVFDPPAARAPVGRSKIRNPKSKIRERPLGGQGGGDRIRSHGKGGAELVPYQVEDVAFVSEDCLTHKDVVALQRPAHRLRLLLPEPRAPFDVGEKESNRALGERRWDGAVRFALSPRLPVSLSPCPPLPCLRPDPLKQRLRLRIGSGVDLPVQMLAQLAIGEQCGRIVAAGCQDLHQRPVCRLSQRLGGDRAAQVALGGVRITHSEGLFRQCLQCLEIRLLADLPLLEGPFLHAALQETATVEGDCLLQ